MIYIIKCLEQIEPTSFIYQAFWRKAGNSGESVYSGGPWTAGADCSCGPLSFTFDDCSASGDPAIVTFQAGSQAVEWRQQTVRFSFMFQFLFN